ncbi:MAG: hypothetical protein JWR26_310 [Pedosphaera sp.]|nr:hypothetical protein [Pedosphaera sp.]
MDITGFNEPQARSLLDLIVLAMYMDGNLASVEAARVQQLLTAMGFKSDYDRNREFDASVTRVRQHAEVPEAARAFAGKLATLFTLPEHRQRVYGMLNDLVASDGQVSAEENKFIAAVKEALQM